MPRQANHTRSEQHFHVGDPVIVIGGREKGLRGTVTFVGSGPRGDKVSVALNHPVQAMLGPALLDPKNLLPVSGRTSNPFVKAQGQLWHHFWGTYHATIGLVFDSPAHAADAKKVLGRRWKTSEKNKAVLGWFGKGDTLRDVIKPQLARYGADPDEIDSVATSIDSGEPFTVMIPKTPREQRSFRFTNPTGGWRFSNPYGCGGCL